MNRARPTAVRRFAWVLAGAALLLSGCSYRLPRLGAITPQSQTSLVLAADGTVVATVHGNIDRRPVPLSRVPRLLQEAVVETEDQRFWTEPAIDPRAVVRALFADLRAGTAAQGGSTIAEQYVKLTADPTGAHRNLSEKLREATLAYQLERHDSRAQVLDLYLNSVYFGAGAYGVEAAAETYFARPVSRLDLAQSCLLAGLIQAPSNDDPFRHPVAAAERRRQVLDRMVASGHVDRSEADRAARAPLVAAPTGPAHYAAPYFVADVEALILSDPAFGATVEARRQALYAGGLRIHTTLDLSQQAEADSAAHRVLPVSNPPSAALVVMDPSTGAVTALVGGQNYWSGRDGSQLDLATESARPSGSTFKPLVLATALSHGFDLGRVYDAPASIALPLTNGVWRVHNYEGEPTGRMNLVRATVVSDNVVYAQLMMQVGPGRVVSTAAALGITSPLAAYPSAVLGANAVDPLEMADAYATLIDGGVHHSAFMVSEVDGPDGRVLYRHRASGHRVLTAAVAAAVDGVLQQVVDQGTGVQARIGRPVAGKTGTTDSWSDAWFVGGTPQLVAAVWVGYPSSERPMVPPLTPFHVTGGTWPARIFQLFASAALADRPVVDFPNPPPAAAADIAGPGGLSVVDVVGFPVDQASQELSREGFLVRTRRVTSQEYPPGYVVAEDPPAGSDAPGGSTVTLDVAA